MEVIKKIIKRKLRTSGTTTVTLVPDRNAIYYFKLNLVEEVHDWGFFDAFTENEETETETDFDFTEVTTEEPIEPPDRELVLITTPLQVTTGGGWTVEYDGSTETSITEIDDNTSIGTIDRDPDGTSSFTTLEEDAPDTL